MARRPRNITVTMTETELAALIQAQAGLVENQTGAYQRAMEKLRAVLGDRQVVSS